MNIKSAIFVRSWTLFRCVICNQKYGGNILQYVPEEKQKPYPSNLEILWYRLEHLDLVLLSLQHQLPGVDGWNDASYIMAIWLELDKPCVPMTSPTLTSILSLLSRWWTCSVKCFIMGATLGKSALEAYNCVFIDGKKVIFLDMTLYKMLHLSLIMWSEAFVIFLCHK